MLLTIRTNTESKIKRLDDLIQKASELDDSVSAGMRRLGNFLWINPSQEQLLSRVGIELTKSIPHLNSYAKKEHSDYIENIKGIADFLNEAQDGLREMQQDQEKMKRRQKKSLEKLQELHKEMLTWCLDTPEWQNALQEVKETITEIEKMKCYGDLKRYDFRTTVSNILEKAAALPRDLSRAAERPGKKLPASHN